MALEPMNTDQAAADIAAENVRLVLSGVLVDPLPGTLAEEVAEEVFADDATYVWKGV